MVTHPQKVKFLSLWVSYIIICEYTSIYIGNADYWCSERALLISDWCSGNIKYNNFLRPFCAFRLLGFWAFEFLGFPASGILDFWAFGLLGFFWAFRLFFFWTNGLLDFSTFGILGLCALRPFEDPSYLSNALPANALHFFFFSTRPKENNTSHHPNVI